MATLRAALLILAVILLLGTPTSAATWYVTQSGTGDATTIQAGIDLASTGDTVLVAPGVYADTLHVMIQGESKVANVHLTKEISLIAEGDTTNTIIDGPESDVAVFVEGVGGGGLIRGFRIQTEFRAFGCVAATTGSPEPPPKYTPPPGYRVGVWCEDASLTLHACAIEGHGECAELYRSPITITECLIGWSFWGVRFFEGSNAVVERIRAQWLAEAFECTASSPSIVDNNIGGFGGQMCTGVDCNQDGDAYIAGNTFRDIEVRGIIVGPADAVIEENLFINGSTAIFISAGTHTPIVRNNIFYDHGGWIIEVRSGAVIEYNTIDYAPGSSTRGIQVQWASPVIRNNILSRLSAGINCVLGASPTIECNNIYATDYPYRNECTDQTGINGNISVDPEFCGIWDTVDYRLQSDSPCAPGNHPDGYECGQIGAKGVGCSTTPTKPRSWGAIKALYRGKERK